MGLDPISLGVMAVGTGVSMYGQHQADKAQQQAARYNNKLAQAEARNHELETNEQIKRKRLENRAILGEMKARMATSGFTSDGTESSVIGESAGRLELEIMDQSRSANMRASSMRQQGKMGLWESAQQSKASQIGMFNTAVNGYAGAYNMTQQNKFYGVK